MVKTTRDRIKGEIFVMRLARDIAKDGSDIVVGMLNSDG